MAIDRSLFLWVNGAAGHVAILDAFFKIMAKDSPYLFALFYIVLWFALPKGDVDTRRALVVSVGTAVLAIVISALIGKIWYVPRPFVVLGHLDHLLIHHKADSSFPSDHAALAFSLAFTVLRRRTWVGWVNLLAAIAVMIARVWVGVHWPTDVIGGAALAFLCSLIVWHWREPLVSLADWWMSVFGMGPRARRASLGRRAR